MQGLLLLSRREEIGNVLAHQKRFAFQLRLRRREKPFRLQHRNSWLSARGAEAEQALSPLCVCMCVCVHTHVCMRVGSRERCRPWAMLGYTGHIPVCPGRRMCLAVPTCMCLVDVLAPGEPCGCPWLLVPLEGDAPSSLSVSFSYVCESLPHQAPWPRHAVLGHEHLGLL